MLSIFDKDIRVVLQQIGGDDIEEIKQLLKQE
jgi:hypothetical protein